jgi:inner membrane protein
MDTLLFEITHWSWWIVALLLIILEITLPGTFFLWLSLSAGFTGVALYIWPALNWEFQLILFALLSIISILISRQYLRKKRSDDSTQTLNQRTDRYLGKIVMVESAIEHGTGQVRIEDSVWRAIGPDTPAGQPVRVVAIEGSSLQVEALH